MKAKALFLDAALVFFVVCSGLPGYAAEFKSPEEMFNETKYTEESYYKTERLLLTATKHLMESRTAPAITFAPGPMKIGPPSAMRIA